MKNNHRALRLAFLLVMWPGLLGVEAASAQDLLGSSRTQILARFGSPLFAPRLGDEDKAEQFHVGAWEYVVGYRTDQADPQNGDKMKVICVLKQHDFSTAQNFSVDDIRLGLMEAENSPAWKPYDPLPFEVNPKPGEKLRDFETLHTRKSDGVLTAKGQTARRRQRLFTFTLEWHGNPGTASAAWFFDLPVDKLEQLFQGFEGGVEEKLKLMPEPTAELKKLLRGK
ncbi:MAG: outer membrane protein assembly factor BamE [Verrucomicrobia bacterium]|nr:outer membrane protein assembly factor BamE [Verrucomicrobiota bacterium]